MATERAPPHRVALALDRSGSGQQVGLAVDLGAGLDGQGRGAVGGVGVDHQQLVDEAELAELVDGADGRGDRRRCFLGRDADGDRLTLAAEEILGLELSVIEGS